VLRTSVVQAARAIADSLRQGGKILVCGNGGSATQAQHLAAELVGRFRHMNRPALPVLSLTADTAVLTAWANDVGYEHVFARQVEALARPGDVVIGLSTSGRSRNVMDAFEAAHRHQAVCISLLGGDGGDLLRLSHLAIVVPSADAQRIQEVHMLIVHLLCELVEEQLISNPGLQSLPGNGARSIWDMPAKSLVPAPLEKAREKGVK
jgi:phosphoheptose isomerase